MKISYEKKCPGAPYLDDTAAGPHQLDLFDAGQVSPALEAFEKALKAIDERHETRTPKLKDYYGNVLQTFNLYPSVSASRHLFKANVKKNNTVAIASDWRKVFEHLYGALLSEAMEVKRQRE